MQVVAMETETETGEMIVKRVSVPIRLEELMEGLTKEVLLKKPDDIYSFAAEYFSQLLLLREKGGYKVKPVRSAQSISKQIPKKSAEKLLVRGASKQLSRQISIRGDSPVKGDAPTRRFPTRRAQTEDRTSDKNRFIERRNKFKKAELDTKSPDIKPKHTPRAVSDTSEDKQNTLNKRDRSLSTSRRGRSVAKSVQSTPSQKSTSTPRRALNSSESNKIPKSHNTGDKGDVSQKDIKSASKDKATAHKVPSVEDTQEFVKDGKLTVVPPTIIKHAQPQNPLELVTSIPVPILVGQILPKEKASNKNEVKEQSQVPEKLENKDTGSNDVESSNEGVVEPSKNAVVAQKEQENKANATSEIAANSANGAKENTPVAIVRQQKDHGNLIGVEETVNKVKEIDAAQTNKREHETRDSVASVDLQGLQIHSDECKPDKDINNVDSTGDILLDRGNSNFSNNNIEDSTTITSEFSELASKSSTDDKEDDTSISSTIPQTSTKSLDKSDSQNLLPDSDSKIISLEDTNDKNKLGKDSTEVHDSTENTAPALHEKDDVMRGNEGKIIAHESDPTNKSEKQSINAERTKNKTDKSIDDKSTEKVADENVAKEDKEELDIAVIKDGKENNGGNEVKDLINMDNKILHQIKEEAALITVNTVAAVKGKELEKSDSLLITDRSEPELVYPQGTDKIEQNIPIEETQKVTNTSGKDLNLMQEAKHDGIDAEKIIMKTTNDIGCVQQKLTKGIDEHVRKDLKDNIEKQDKNTYKNLDSKLDHMSEITVQKSAEKVVAENIGKEEKEELNIGDIKDDQELTIDENQKVTKSIEKYVNIIPENSKEEAYKNEDHSNKVPGEDKETKAENNRIQSKKEIYIDKGHPDFLKDPNKIKEVQYTESNTVYEDNMKGNENIESAEEEIQNKAMRELGKNNNKPTEDILNKISKSTNAIKEDDKIMQSEKENEIDKGQSDFRKDSNNIRDTRDSSKEETDNIESHNNRASDGDAIEDKVKIIPSSKEKCIDILHPDFRKNPNTIKDIHDNEFKVLNRDNMKGNTTIVSAEQEIENKAMSELGKKACNNSKPTEDNLEETSRSHSEGDGNVEKGLLERDEDDKKININNTPKNLVVPENDEYNNLVAKIVDNIDTKENMQKSVEEITIKDTAAEQDNNTINIKKIDQQEKRDYIEGKEEYLERDSTTNISKINNIYREHENVNTGVLPSKDQPLKENKEVTENNNTGNNVDKDISDKEENENTKDPIKHSERSDGTFAEDNIIQDEKEHPNVEPQLLSNTESTPSSIDILKSRKPESKIDQSEVVSKLSPEGSVLKNETENDVQIHKIESNFGTESISNHKQAISENNKINKEYIVIKDSLLHSDGKKDIKISEEKCIETGQDQITKEHSSSMKCDSTALKADQDITEINTEILKDSDSSIPISGTDISDIHHATGNILETESNKRSLETSDSAANPGTAMKDVINSVITVVKDGPVDQVVKKYIGDFIHNEKENVFILKPDQIETGMVNNDTSNEQEQIGERADVTLAETEANLKESSKTNSARHAMKNTNMQNIINSTLLVTKTGTVDTIVKENINDFLHNEKQHVFKYTNDMDFNNLMEDQNQVSNNDNKVDGKKISAIETESQAGINILQDGHPNNIKQSIKSKNSRTLSQTQMQVGESNVKKTESRGERKLRRVKTVDVIKDESKPTTEIRSRIPTADYRHRVKRDIDSGKHSIRIQQKPNIKDEVDIVPCTLNTLNKMADENKNKDNNEMVNATALKNENTLIDDKERLNEAKDLGLVKVPTIEKIDKEITDTTKTLKIPQTHTKITESTEDDRTKTKSEDVIVDKTQAETKFDTSKLREELRTVEHESKLSTFKSTYNPYVLRQEIKQASQHANDNNDEIGKTSLENMLTPITAALKIQSAWRRLRARRNTLKQNTKSESSAAELKTNVVQREDLEEIKGEIKDDNKGDTLKSKNMANESFLVSSSFEGQKFLEAALVIQRIWRGFNVRKRFINSDEKTTPMIQNSALPQESQRKGNILNLKSTSLAPETEYSRAMNKNFVNAAITIQKIWRGFRIRKSKNENKEIMKREVVVDSSIQKKNDDTDIGKPADNIEVVTSSETKRKEPFEEVELDSLENDLPVKDMKLENAVIAIQKIWRGFHVRKILYNRNKKLQVTGSLCSPIEDNGKREKATLPSSAKEVKTEVTSSPPITDSKFIDAAILVQRVWRGFKVRKHLNEMKKNNIQQVNTNQNIAVEKKVAPDDINKQLQLHLEKQPSVDNEKFIKAAITVQKLWRGFKVRKIMKMGNLFGTSIEAEKPHIEYIEAAKNSDQKDKKSALKIQSLWRGYHVRKNINIIKNKLDDNPTLNDEGHGRELNDGDILNAATKIQAGVRGYLQRKRYKKDSNNLNSITEEEINDKGNTKNTDSGVRKLTEKEVAKALEDLNKVVIPNHSPTRNEPNKSILHRTNTVQEPDIIKKQNAPLFKSMSLNQGSDLETKRKHDTKALNDDNNNSSEKHGVLTPLEIEIKEAIESMTEDRLLINNISAESNDGQLNLDTNIDKSLTKSTVQSNTYLKQGKDTLVDTAGNSLKGSMIAAEQIKSNDKIGQQSESTSKLASKTSQIFQINPEQKAKEIESEKVSDTNKSTSTLNVQREQSSEATSTSNDLKDGNTDENKIKEISAEKEDKITLAQESKSLDNKEDNKLNDDVGKSEITQPLENITHTEDTPDTENIKYQIKEISAEKEDKITLAQESKSLDDKEDNKLNDDVGKSEITQPLENITHTEDTPDTENIDEKPKYDRPVSIDSTDSAITVIYNELEDHEDNDENRSKINDDIPKKAPKKDDEIKERLLEHEQLLNDLQNKLLDQISGKNGELSAENISTKLDIDLLRKELEDAAFLYNPQENHIIHQNSKEEVNDQLLDYLTYVPYEKKDTDNSLLTKLPSRDLPDITEEDSEVKSVEDSDYSDDVFVNNSSLETENHKEDTARVKGNILSNETDIAKIQSTLKECEKIAREINMGINNFDAEEDSVAEQEVEVTEKNHSSDDKENCTDQLDSSFCKIPNGVISQTKTIDNKPLIDHVEFIDKVEGSDHAVKAKLEDVHNRLREGDSLPTDLSASKGADSNSTTSNSLVHTGELHDSLIVPLPTPSNTSQDTTHAENMGTKSSCEDVARTTTNTNSELLHTGELHDSLIIPLPLAVQDSLKSDLKEYGSNTILPESQLLQPSSVDASSVSAASYAVNNTKQLEMNTITKGLLHTGELHDTLVIPLSVEAQRAENHNNISQTASDLSHSESEVTDLTDQKQNNASSELPSNPKSATGTTGLLHTGEFHDMVMLPGTIITDAEYKAASEHQKKVFTQVDSECQTSGDGNVPPIEVHLNQVQAGAATLTSPRSICGVPDVTGVQDDIAQAPDKGALPIEFRPDFSSPPDLQSMESEKRKNATINNKSMEVQAATKIQAGFRGYQVRKQLKQKNGSSDINNQKRHARRKSSGRITDTGRISQNKTKDSNDVEEKSAVKIQAGVRGFLVRRRQKKQKNQES